MVCGMMIISAWNKVRGRSDLLTVGAETRKERVTSRGTSMVADPMNTGTAELEQKGVTVPTSVASPSPTDSRFGTQPPGGFPFAFMSAAREIG